MNRTDRDYAAFCTRLPKLRRLADYVPRVHHLELTRGRGDSLQSITNYYTLVTRVYAANRCTLKRLVALADHVERGMSPCDAARQAWSEFPDPHPGRPARPDWVLRAPERQVSGESRADPAGVGAVNGADAWS